MGNVCTCHGFLPRISKFEKVGSKTFLHKFIKGFVNRGFGNPWKPLINRIYGTQQMTLCNSKQASQGATRFKERHVKTTCESSDDRPNPKP